MLSASRESTKTKKTMKKTCNLRCSKITFILISLLDKPDQAKTMRNLSTCTKYSFSHVCNSNRVRLRLTNETRLNFDYANPFTFY